MNPEQPSPSPAPEQPSPPPTVVPAGMPQPTATPATNPMPPTDTASSAQPAQPQPPMQTGIGTIDVEKDKKKALWLAIGSIVVFVLGFLLGFAALIGVALGAWAIRLARPAKAKTALTIGIIGLVLNAALMLLVLLVR